jgi:hypothetical protein
MATVMRWLSENTHPRFREQYALARELQGHVMGDMVLDIVHEVLKPDRLDPQRARAAIDALKWQAAKLAPTVYGEKTTGRNLTGKSSAFVFIDTLL